VTVKWGITSTSARNLAPKRARELIEAGAREALGRRDAIAPYDPGKPCEIKVEFKSTDGVEEYRNRRGVEVLDPRLIVSRADDWWTAWNQFFF
jgi:D-amino peptidase